MTSVTGSRGLLRPEVACIGAAVATAPLALEIPTPVKLVLLAAAIAMTAVGGPICGVLLVCLALPLASTVLAVGSSEWAPLELALIACGLSTAVYVLKEVARERSLSRLKHWLIPIDVIFLGAGLVALAGVSLLWVADTDLRSDSVRSLRRVIIEPLVVVPAISAVRRTGVERRVGFWIAWPAVAVSILAIGQLILGKSTVDIGGVARPIGTFTHPNNLAFYLERAVWFSPFVAFALSRRLGRVAWIVVGVIVVAALATLSRGAAVGLAAGAAIMFWERIRANWRIFAAASIAGAAAVFASRYLAESGDSVESRTTIWRSAFNMLRDRPVTGVGLDQFLGQYGRRYVRPEGWAERYTSHPHNVVLDFWLSLGLGGLAILWLLIEVTWRRIRDALRSPIWSVQRAGVAMVPAGLVHGLIDNSFFLPYLATMTWIGLTIGVQSAEMPPDE